jgi:hypothetical protein
VFVLCLCTAAFATTPTTSNVGLSQDQILALKSAQDMGIPDPQPQVGGEDIGTAVVIPALPYTDGGNTCGFLDDYDEACPYTGSLAPDVVYSYSPAVDETINIDTCSSAYDTKLYVYENAAGNLIACNDDSCPGFMSELFGVPVTAGNTYYIVVDGWSGACGDYVLDVVPDVPCVIECPPGSVLEGEPVCGTDYNDVFNGGCNSIPPVFSSIPCSPDGAVTVCGEYGGFLFNGLSYRDTDWYFIDGEINDSGVTICVSGQYDTLTGYLDPVCPATFFIESASIGPCDTACFNLPAGDWYFFVGTAGFGPNLPCGAAYTMTLDGYTCPPVSVENASWGEIKALHR